MKNYTGCLVACALLAGVSGEATAAVGDRTSFQTYKSVNCNAGLCEVKFAAIATKFRVEINHVSCLMSGQQTANYGIGGLIVLKPDQLTQVAFHGLPAPTKGTHSMTLGSTPYTISTSMLLWAEPDQFPVIRMIMNDGQFHGLTTCALSGWKTQVKP